MDKCTRCQTYGQGAMTLCTNAWRYHRLSSYGRLRIGPVGLCPFRAARGSNPNLQLEAPLTNLALESLLMMLGVAR